MRTTPLLLILTFVFLAGCKQEPPKALSAAELSTMANTIKSEGPREGNNYKVFFLALRQNQQPAVGFKIDAYVKGKSEPISVRTNKQGLAEFKNLPFPGMRNKLVCVLHYYSGKEDSAREITYPFIEGDAYRLKDIQYIPNTVTPDPA